MINTELFKNLDLSNLTNKKTVIDCGHIAVNFDHGKNSIKPSPDQLATLEIGLLLFNRLSNQKEITLSICLTDTSKHLHNQSNRDHLKGLINKQDLTSLLPETYLNLINQNQIPFNKICITLQTQNTNKFSNKIKQIKKKAKQLDAQSLYEQFKLILIKTDENFGFTTPFLFKIENENALLGSDWWQEEFYRISNNDTLLAPLLRLKKLKIINLYNQNKGTLCPATYGGLLLNFDSETDHIAIYSRADDEFITEKIARGIIAIILLYPEHRSNHLTIVANNNSHEIFTLNQQDVISQSPDFNSFMEQYNNSELSSLYSPYTS